MSRIHEALRKATEERTRLLAAAEPIDQIAATADIYESVRAPSQVAQRTILGTRPSELGPCVRFDDLVKWCSHPEWNPDPSSNPFHQPDDSARICAERFRTLRSRLNQIAATRQLRRLLVTSSTPAEGKTFVVTNLARSIICQPQKRVLLIDSDLRAPKLHVALGAPNSPGLADYLRGETDEFAVIQQGPAPNLCFIPCGRTVSDPSELLSGDRMKGLLELVTPLFDWVILDSPPVLPVHDASILADSCDGVLFVVRAGETSHEIAERGTSEIRDKNLLGVVLNQVEKAQSYEGHYSGYLSEEQ